MSFCKFQVHQNKFQLDLHPKNMMGELTPCLWKGREGTEGREAKENGNKDRKGMTGPGKLRGGIGKEEEKRIDPSAEISKILAGLHIFLADIWISQIHLTRWKAAWPYLRGKVK